MALAGAREEPRKALNWKRVVGFVISVLIVIAIFWWAIPKFADYRDVWAAMRTLTPIEAWSLLAATAFNLVTYWWANQAALPGLGLGKAAVLTQTTTTVANTLPAGGALAVGLTYSILDSWGFSGTSIALYVGVTGIWNIFTKLALPMLSLVFLALSGHLTTTYVTAAIVGLIVLGVGSAWLRWCFGARSSPSRSGTGWVASPRGSAGCFASRRSRPGARARRAFAGTRSS
jgi:putative heme transporter